MQALHCSSRALLSPGLLSVGFVAQYPTARASEDPSLHSGKARPHSTENQTRKERNSKKHGKPKNLNNSGKFKDKKQETEKAEGRTHTNESNECRQK